MATPEAWENNYELVLNFYNERLQQLDKAFPNDGHNYLTKLESHYEVQIITQNVDDLHEKAGSSNVLHLHGELRKKRSQVNPDYILEIDKTENQIKKGDLCPWGLQMRPHIVWFGEAVPLIEEAAKLVEQADIFIL